MALHNLLHSSSSSSSSSRSHPQFNFIAHSMGGLDARYLISNIRPDSYSPISLTTICTPHRGSPFMDWCRANIGVGSGKEGTSEDSEGTIPFSLKVPLLRPPTEELGYLPNNLLKVLLLNLLDSPAYSNLSTGYLRKVFNPGTRDVRGVQYFSVAARVGKMGPMHPLWLPGLLMDRLGAADQEGHDGLVTVHSARWGTFLGVVDNTDHWEIRGSAAFGLNHDSSHHHHNNSNSNLQNLQAKSRWLELNRYIGSWLHHHSDPEPTHLSHSTSSTDLNPSANPDDLFRIRDQNHLSTRLLAHWIANKLPRNLLPASKPSSHSSSTLSSHSHSQPNTPPLSYPYKNPTRTVHPNFPFDDLDFNLNSNDTHPNNNSSKKSSFDIEAFYLAICRNLYDNGL